MNLQGVGCKLLGAILNGANLEEGLGLSGHYRYYYREDGDEVARGWRGWIPRVLRLRRERDPSLKDLSEVPGPAVTRSPSSPNDPVLVKTDPVAAEDQKKGNGGETSRKNRHRKDGDQKGA